MLTVIQAVYNIVGRAGRHGVEGRHGMFRANVQRRCIWELRRLSEGCWVGGCLPGGWLLGDTGDTGNYTED